MNTFLSHVVEIEEVDLKRSRIKPVSDKRRAENKVRAQMMEEKFGPREEWTCQFWSVAYIGQLFDENESPQFHFGEINGHEFKKRSAGGSITDPDNVILLCNWHNGWVEENPELALAYGLVIR